VSVKAVTPSAAAASPSHPEHARWVKEQTLKREIEDARAIGLSARWAETLNARNLERLSNRKRKPAVKKAPKPPAELTPEQLAKAGVTKKIATARKLPSMPACNLCRQCLRCKRELRMSQIASKAKQLDQKAIGLAMELSAIVMAAARRNDYRDAIGRELPFSRLVGHDVDRAVTAGCEWVCDRSTSFMGQWR
jgi:hypothetical protein